MSHLRRARFISLPLPTVSRWVNFTTHLPALPIPAAITRDSVMGFGFPSPNRRQQIFRRGIVAERFAHVDEEIFVPRCKHKAAAELQWIFAQTVLFVSGGLSASGRRHYPSTYLGSNARTQAPLSRAASLPSLFASGPNWQNPCREATSVLGTNRHKTGR